MDHFETTTDRARLDAARREARILESRHSIGVIDAQLAEMDRMEERGIPDDLRTRFDDVRAKLIECRAGFVLLEESDRDHPV